MKKQFIIKQKSTNKYYNFVTQRWCDSITSSCITNKYNVFTIARYLGDVVIKLYTDKVVDNQHYIDAVL